MITKYHIRNFKSLVDVYCEFEKINVIIGPNGSGKSSFLQSIDFLRAFFQTSIELYLKENGWEFKDLPNIHQKNKPIKWNIVAKLESNEEGKYGGLYEYNISLSYIRGININEELIYKTTENSKGNVLLRKEARKLEVFDLTERKYLTLFPYVNASSFMANIDEKIDSDRFPELLHFRKYIKSIRAYLIWDPKILRARDRGKHEELGPSGEHLATFIANMKATQPKQFQKLVKQMKKLIPNLIDITIKGGRGWGWKEIQIVEQLGSGDSITLNSRQISDGMLRLLAIATFRFRNTTPGVLTFEEPENGVHPQLLKEVVNLIKEITELKSPRQSQVFMTTHSPYVLDEFIDSPGSIFLMQRKNHGEGSELFRLTTNTQIDLARELYNQSLGELWYTGLLGDNARGKFSGSN